MLRIESCLATHPEDGPVFSVGPHFRVPTCRDGNPGNFGHPFASPLAGIGDGCGIDRSLRLASRRMSRQTTVFVCLCLHLQAVRPCSGRDQSWPLAHPRGVPTVHLSKRSRTSRNWGGSRIVTKPPKPSRGWSGSGRIFPLKPQAPGVASCEPWSRCRLDRPDGEIIRRVQEPASAP